jgi:hypothetical protein
MTTFVSGLSRISVVGSAWEVPPRFGIRLPENNVARGPGFGGNFPEELLSNACQRNAVDNRDSLSKLYIRAEVFCELSQDQSAGAAVAVGDFGFKVLASSNPAEKTKKLSAEIAKGRLAMMAIVVMFFRYLQWGSKCPGGNRSFPL